MPSIKLEGAAPDASWLDSFWAQAKRSGYIAIEPSPLFSVAKKITFPTESVIFVSWMEEE